MFEFAAQTFRIRSMHGEKLFSPCWNETTNVPEWRHFKQIVHYFICDHQAKSCILLAKNLYCVFPGGTLACLRTRRIVPPLLPPPPSSFFPNVPLSGTFPRFLPNNHFKLRSNEEKKRRGKSVGTSVGSRFVSQVPFLLYPPTFGFSLSFCYK